MSDKASRFNAGKIDLTLLPTAACRAEARVWMAGARKYSKDNWKKLWGDQTVDVVMASAMRHMFAILDGEERDPESGEYHAAHVRCNMAMLIEYYERKESHASSKHPESTGTEGSVLLLDGRSTPTHYTDNVK